MQEQLPRKEVKTHHYGGYVMWGINRVAPTHPTFFYRVQRSFLTEDMDCQRRNHFNLRKL